MKCVGRKCRFSLVLVLGATLLAAGSLSAQQTSSPATVSSSTTQHSSKAVNDRLAQPDRDVKAAQSSADNAWMLISAALVLMMTGPGLALFYGGLARRESVLAIRMQSVALLPLIP